MDSPFKTQLLNWIQCDDRNDDQLYRLLKILLTALTNKSEVKQLINYYKHNKYKTFQRLSVITEFDPTQQVMDCIVQWLRQSSSDKRLGFFMDVIKVMLIVVNNHNIIKNTLKRVKRKIVKQLHENKAQTND